MDNWTAAVKQRSYCQTGFFVINSHASQWEPGARGSLLFIGYNYFRRGRWEGWRETGWTGEMWRRGRIKRSDGAITPSLGDYRYYSFFDTLAPVGVMANTGGDRSPKKDTRQSERDREGRKRGAVQEQEYFSVTGYD